MNRARQLWWRGLGLFALGALLFFGGFSLLLGHGPPGVVLATLWCVPVSATMAGASYVATRRLFFSWRKLFALSWSFALAVSLTAHFLLGR